jgi:hypothetical protein
LAVFGTLPTLIKSDNIWITFRGAFAFFSLVMMAGVGLAFFFDRFKSIKSKIFVFFFYLMLISPFFYIYFFRYPIAQTLHKGFYYRILANYIDRQAEQNFILVTDRTDASYDYLFNYNQYIKTESEADLNKFAQSSDKQFDNGRIKIFGSCPENLSEMINNDTTLIVDSTNQTCKLENFDEKKVRIVSLIDSGSHFFIINDQLCSSYSLPPFLNLKENLLAVERLDQSTFCQSFFIK